ncbi:hypothetical protein HJG60_007772 [Phyllostomus discolor]|uniref:Uncharacterized protein n=1 Tax=Phyllostomus discolor TaxID=89673 RepID=A0A834BHE5_9CHIR|nr:hypothetical protein HJG60_007772 [Phyllostomus discolor]
MALCLTSGCFPPQGFPPPVPCARSRLPAHGLIAGSFTSFRSRLRCRLAREVTLFSIQAALPPPRVLLCHFHPSCCPVMLSPRLLPLPDLASCVSAPFIARLPLEGGCHHTAPLVSHTFPSTRKNARLIGGAEQLGRLHTELCELYAPFRLISTLVNFTGQLDQALVLSCLVKHQCCRCCDGISWKR